MPSRSSEHLARLSVERLQQLVTEGDPIRVRYLSQYAQSRFVVEEVTVNDEIAVGTVQLFLGRYEVVHAYLTGRRDGRAR